MPTTIGTRKPVEDLTTSDLEAFPVWEFATDEEGAEDQDETWINPVLTGAVPADGYSLTVAAVFRLAGGLVYPGVIYCDTNTGFDVAGIALLTTAGRLMFSAGDSPAETKRSLKSLGMAAQHVFPLEYCTRVPLEHTGKLERGSFSV